jgi:hypothetical protein
VSGGSADHRSRQLGGSPGHGGELAEEPGDVLDMPRLDHLLVCDPEHVEIGKVNALSGGPNAECVVDWVQRENTENLMAGRSYLAGKGNFPERAAQNLIGGRFLADFYAMVADWALWATKIVETWPDDPRGVPLDCRCCYQVLM